MQSLPIDALLPSIVTSLREAPNLVLEAPPGAGKTTRVPRALLDAGLPTHGEIVVLEPRRLAARLAARRVAEELGEPVGNRVGYQVRFENISSPQTRIRFVTEGVLTRQLLKNPHLKGVGAVVFDEFHERHLEGDMALALLLDLQRRHRPALLLIVMSATLEGASIAKALSAPILRSEGRPFAVSMEHLAKEDDRPLASQVTSALTQLVREDLQGHVLVFLPGASEIRKARQACETIATREGLLVLPLHGDLSPEEQDRAVLPSQKRKVLLSTNVAESSVTIDGVAAVIDSGLARVVTHSPWSGFSSLRTERISRASAAQRSGRAGRTRAGRCLRLYTQRDHDTRREYDLAEIHRADLTQSVLELCAYGYDPLSFLWLEAPSTAVLQAAARLLQHLGALDTRNQITELGRRMLAFPLHPRLARLLVEAERSGVGNEGALLAALLGERDIRVSARAQFNGKSQGVSQQGASGPSDVMARCDDFHAAADRGFDPQHLRELGLDPSAVHAVRRVHRQLVRLLSHQAPHSTLTDTQPEEALLRGALMAYPDRVARRRRPTARDLVLCAGGSAVLSRESVVHHAPFVVVLDADEAEERGGRHGASVFAHSVSAIEPEWLLELFPDRVHDKKEILWNDSSERVEVLSQLLYEDLVLDESRTNTATSDDTDVAAALAEAAWKKGLNSFVTPPGALDAWLARVRFVASLEAGFPTWNEEGLRCVLLELCRGRRSLAELREADLLGELQSLLPPAQLAQTHTWAPERIELPNGRHANVCYATGKGPYIESRIQDFFGWQHTPTLAGGQVHLVLHLLAPNGRPVQVTADLEGFWKRTYPGIRNELSRRYPRHAWPENPRTPLEREPRGGARR